MATFPTLAGGERTHRPWSYKREFLTTRNDMPTGKRYAYYHRATPLMRWTIGGESISDADVATLRNFFEARGGSYETFEFVDPETGTTHTKCRFDQGGFEERHIGPNENSVRLVIVEVG